MVKDDVFVCFNGAAQKLITGNAGWNYPVVISLDGTEFFQVLFVTGNHFHKIIKADNQIIGVFTFVIIDKCGFAGAGNTKHMHQNRLRLRWYRGNKTVDYAIEYFVIVVFFFVSIGNYLIYP